MRSLPASTVNDAGTEWPAGSERSRPSYARVVPHPDAGRFLTMTQVAEELATSKAQIDALIKRGELRAIKLGGRGVWRIERSELEAFIARAYEETAQGLQEGDG